jgi:hypothetical protein
MAEGVTGIAPEDLMIETDVSGEEMLAGMRLLDPIAINPDLSADARSVVEKMGLRIVEKSREVEIPVLPEDDKELAKMLGFAENARVRGPITRMTNYLFLPAVVDKFRENSEARKRWKADQLEPEILPVYAELMDDNQFRMQHIIPMPMSAHTLGIHYARAGKTDMQDYMRNLFPSIGTSEEDVIKAYAATANLQSGELNFADFNRRLTGYNFASMEDKVDTIRMYENRIVEAMRKMFGDNAEYKKVKVT